MIQYYSILIQYSIFNISRLHKYFTPIFFHTNKIPTRQYCLSFLDTITILAFKYHQITLKILSCQYDGMFAVYKT